MWMDEGEVVAPRYEVCEEKGDVLGIYIRDADELQWHEIFEIVEEVLAKYFPGYQRLDVRDEGRKSCNDEEAFHFEWNGDLYHVCYSDRRYITVSPEVQCPYCGEFIPYGIYVTHISEFHQETEDE